MKPTMTLRLQVTTVMMVIFAIIPTVTAREVGGPSLVNMALTNYFGQSANYFGQSPSQSTEARDRERSRVTSERDLEQRIWNLRMLSEQARKPVRQRPNVQQALAQMQEDFTRLQIINKSLGLAAIGKNALDLRFVSKSVSEIRKRAERLNVNLALPQPEVISELPTTDPVARSEQMKSSVLKLVKVVYSFVDNPFFKEVNVIDTQLTTKARRDLEEIIELSEQLKKDSDRLDKGRP